MTEGTLIGITPGITDGISRNWSANVTLAIGNSVPH